MSDHSDPPPAPESAASFLAKLLPLAPIILIAAAGLGFISAFLPAVNVAVFGITDSVAVVSDWRGKLGLLGYIAVGVMAGLTMAKTIPLTKGLVLAVLITAGVVLLMALLLLVAASGGLGTSIGFGCFTNLLAALGLGAGAALLAKREKLF